MIIPVKCFTCGEVLADKYRYYQEQVRKIKADKNMNIDKVIYLTEDNIEKTPEGEVLDELELNNEFAAQRKAGTSVDGDIGPDSRGAFEEWLTKAGISFSDNASDLELVRLVNSN